MSIISGNINNLKSAAKSEGFSGIQAQLIAESLKNEITDIGNQPKITTKVIPQDIVVENPIEIKKGIDTTADNKMLKLKQNYLI